MPPRSRRRFRALVLAAGFGTRLRPLTDELPKPLLPLLGRSLLQRSLVALAAAGCDAAAVNLHHRGDEIAAAIGDAVDGMPVVYSREDPILGTGGALVPLRDFFGLAADVVIVNGDSLCDWPLAELLAGHRRGGALATLLLAGRPDPRAFGGGIGVDRRGRATAIYRDDRFGEVAGRRVFAGAHVLRPELLDRLPAGESDSMRDLYRPLLAEGGRIATVTTWRPWHDLGTPGRYLEAAVDLARRERRGSWVAAGARVAATARLDAAVLEDGVEAGEGAALRRVAAQPGAVVGAGARLRDVVLGPRAEVPAGTAWSEVMLTRWSAAGSRPAGSRREGDLLVSPLEPLPPS